MTDKTMKRLTAALVITVVVCIGVFAYLTRLSGEKNELIISEMSRVYMEEMTQRSAMHFTTSIDLRMSQLDNIINTAIYEEHDSYESFTEYLGKCADLRDFDSLALYSEDGEIFPIYGESFTLYDNSTFCRVLKSGENRYALGYTEWGVPLMVIGVQGSYPLSDGRRSIAIVGAIPSDEYASMLSLNGGDQLNYFHIVRTDGLFVLKGKEISESNYFDYIEKDFGSDFTAEAEDYISGLKTAFEEGRSFSKLIYLGDTRRQMLAAPLEKSSWYLLSVMPYGEIDELVNSTNREWTITVIGCCTIVIVLLIIIFIIYTRLARNYIKQLEISQQAALDATRAKSEFLSNMSHDIRTPMNAIVGMTAIAAANIEDTDHVRECLKKITLSGKHLLGLINDILDMSKIESGKMTLNMEQLSLREVMDSIVNIARPQIKAKNQHFDVFISNIISEDVYCDSVRLSQVLLNLLSNAIKFTPEEGSIKVTLYEEESPIGDTHVRVHMIVEDSGIGMSEEFKKRVFESFMREDRQRVHKTEGTGLGMAITKYIVDAMGGTIDVESEQGKGTSFHVTVDMERALVREEEMILPDWNMLLVDDDEQLCVGVLDSLREIGINADHTLDGESAVEMVKRKFHTNNAYRIILLDWKLPGIDGIETARRIKALTGEDIPIILISAYDWGEIEAEAREAGISGFISKPLFKSSLYYGLKKFIVGNDAPERSEEKKEDLGGKRILIAEDNDLNWEIADALLSDLNLKLERAENGQICLDMFRTSEEGYYDAILMDIRMPVMTGYEAAAEIRNLDRGDADIPIIAMTADAFSEDIKKCLEYGMNAHIAKPIDVEVAAKLLSQYLK